MAVTCPKCQHVRTPADTAPEWQCPACGIVYAKFSAEPAARPEPQAIIYAPPDKPGMSLVTRLVLAAVLTGALYAGARQLTRIGVMPSAPPAGPGMQVGAQPGVPGGMSALEGVEMQPQDGGQYTMKVENGQLTAWLEPVASTQLSALSKNRVVLFSTSWCGYCKQVRQTFRAAGISYDDVDIERDPAAAAYHRDVLHAGGVPVVVMGKRLILGYDEAQLQAGMKELGS